MEEKMILEILEKLGEKEKAKLIGYGWKLLEAQKAKDKKGKVKKGQCNCD